MLLTLFLFIAPELIPAKINTDKRKIYLSLQKSNKIVLSAIILCLCCETDNRLESYLLLLGVIHKRRHT